MVKFLLFLSLIVLLNCSGSYQKDLQSSPTLKSIFTPPEIQDLSILLEFFQDEICSLQQSDYSDISKCYASYLDRLKKSSANGKIEINIPYESQKILYSQISDSTFNEIWSFEKGWVPHTSDTLMHIYFNPRGKYIEFLEELGKENQAILDYYRSYVETGDISPSMVASLLENHKSYDVHDIRVQLFVAIHYLTLNDQLHRQ
jgi:hypothetical protein